VKLFVLNPRYAYWKVSAFLVWPIILSALSLCVCFATSIFTKVEDSSVYLFNMYVLVCIKLILFLFVFFTRACTDFDANAILKIVLCFGFLFILLEFLHAQMSKTYIMEKTILSAIMGITSCSTPIVLMSILHVDYSFFIFYLLYALYIFVLSILGKETKSSILFQCSFIAVTFLLSPIVITNGPSIKHELGYIVFLEIFAVFSCTQLMLLKGSRVPVTKSFMQILTSCILPKFHCTENVVSCSNDLSSKALPIINGAFMLVIRLIYFTFLAISLATIWRDF
jgi:hypothetical protein